MKISYIVIFGVLICSANTQENSINLKKGEVYRIEQECNPSIGHSWILSPLPKDAPVAVVKEGIEHRKDLPTDKQYWIIKAHDTLTKEQVIKLVFLSTRAWFKDDMAEVEEYTVRVH